MEVGIDGIAMHSRLTWELTGFERNTTKARFEFTFRGEVPSGETVWLTAYWYNPRRETGPACEAVSTNIRTGVVIGDDGSMRITPATVAAAIRPLRKVA